MTARLPAVSRPSASGRGCEAAAAAHDDAARPHARSTPAALGVQEQSRPVWRRSRSSSQNGCGRVCGRVCATAAASAGVAQRHHSTAASRGRQRLGQGREDRRRAPALTTRADAHHSHKSCVTRWPQPPKRRKDHLSSNSSSNGGWRSRGGVREARTRKGTTTPRPCRVPARKNETGLLLSFPPLTPRASACVHRARADLFVRTRRAPKDDVDTRSDTGGKGSRTPSPYHGGRT